ncbi:TonB-dependent siderophore receptor FetA/FrpB [Neisseria gonorrhoeae]|uniref:TonB-dependent receptor n=4 Tax=Neisseria gonorrhoeae TaxID=485 RepID=A0AAX2TRZ7_NEIGO|nr:TonB-dependent siderophore receptor FetA/FrpB [Neisseria gonorrhoeae]AZG33167.1 TonB-dependent receptor [Neisseria gonorrhoeae]MBT8024908.1 TonB-dependent receptor [Neisseria gonorrhoeae]MCU9816951.1 TonB-dependent siderophore receptor FetA/FrpB [Neisseria gonorrhoeae]MCU9818823.1 TonB-dependent siderophore receptor FetA/FrpB [Neisseria gonorrhoeae]MCU9821110.1 TonB-dependent siderophore receptor FetA/FrpB [Neisseria gonorrhoeae]
MNAPFFRLSLLSLTLAAGFAHAAENNANVALDTVTVKGDRQGSKIRTNIVTLQQKDESTATDMRELLKEEPSIDFGGGNGTSQFLTLRGMGQNSVDIKVDNAYSDSQILYHQGRFIVDPALVKVVSVQKGAGSASAGIGATNGAIIAKTVDAQDLLKGLDKNWGVRLNSGFAGNNGVSYGASVFGKEGNFDGLFSYNRNDEKDYEAGKGFRNDNGGKTVPYSALDKRSYLAKIGTTFGDGDHRIVLSHMKDQHRGIRTVREEFAVSEKNSRITIKRQAPSYRETTQSNTNLAYTGKDLGFVEKLDANAYVLEKKRYSADDKDNGYAGNVKGPNHTRIATRGMNFNFDSRLAEQTLLKYGINYRHQEIKPQAFLNSEFSIPIKEKKNGQEVDKPMEQQKKDRADEAIVRSYRLTNPTKTDTGAYIEAIHEIDGFTLTGGLRYDRFKVKTHDGKTVSSSSLNPSFGVIWQPREHWSFSASHNYAGRSPRLYDALQTHGKRGIISIADGTKAERARNTEIGFNYNDGTFAANGSYFRQTIKDALANPQNRHDSVAVREAVNAGYIKNHGYELGASYRTGGLTAKVGVSRSKPRFYDTHPKKLLSANPEFGAQTGRTWTASLAYRFKNPNLEIGWRGRYVQKATGSILAAGQKDRDGKLENVVRQGFGVNDVFANWKPLGKDTLNVNLSVNNVFDKFYYPHSQRWTNTLPGVGRDVRLGVNYKF